MSALLSDYYFLVLGAVMLLTGGMGGAVNHFFAQEDQKQTSVFGRAMLVGIVAAFMVPLFLNMISSNLLDQIRGTAANPGDPMKLLVFAGFCLVAAVSSRAFIKTLSERVVKDINQVKQELGQTRQELHQTKQEAGHAKQDAGQAKQQAGEAKRQAGEAKQEAGQAKQQAGQALDTMQLVIEPASDEAETEAAAVAPPARPALSDSERRVLQAFKNSKFVLRSLHGLSTDSRVPRGDLEDVLAALEGKQLVGQRIGQKSAKWYITQRGLDALAE